MMHIGHVLDNVVNLDNARIRKATGQPLTDPAGATHPRAQIRPGMYAKTPTTLIILVREVGWVKGVLHARYIMGGAVHSIPVADLVPTTPAPANF